MLKTKVNINNKLSEEYTINHRFSQGCPLLSILFTINMNEMIVKWNKIYKKKSFTLRITTRINTSFCR